MNWFRMYHEFSTDPKIQMMSEVMQRRIVMLFCLRCNNNVTLHDQEIAFQLRISNEEWAATKAIFIEKKFIDECNNILNWDKRQYLSDSSAERVRRHRESKKEPKKDDVTTCNVTVTPPDTDTDTDKKDIFLKKEKKEKTEFDDFWKLCPRKVGKGAAELKFWIARQEATQEVLLTAMKAHAKEMAEREVDFIPHPATWLHQKRYLDETAEAAQEFSKTDWQPWQQEIAARLGDSVARAWFLSPERRDNALVFKNKFCADKVRDAFMFELSKIGITEILHE